ncbi:MAG: hypothetical protein RJA09_125 [Pseudomonadota bacterium]
MTAGLRGWAVWSLLGCWALAGVVGAQTLSGGAWAAQAAVLSWWSNPQAQGQARLRVWGFQVYDARLWVSPGVDPNQLRTTPHALELDYLRAFKGADIANRSLQEMLRQGPLPTEQANTWLRQMTALFPDVVAGDEITGLYLPGEGLRFFWNGRPLGVLSDPVLAERFMGIWLSTATSEPALRSALLAPFAAGGGAGGGR